MNNFTLLISLQCNTTYIWPFYCHNANTPAPSFVFPGSPEAYPMAMSTQSSVIWHTDRGTVHLPPCAKRGHPQTYVTDVHPATPSFNASSGLKHVCLPATGWGRRYKTVYGNHGTTDRRFNPTVLMTMHSLLNADFYIDIINV